MKTKSTKSASKQALRKTDATSSLRDFCCVVEQCCEAPPMDKTEDYTPKKVSTTCFCCGLNVCRKCSSIRTYYNYGRVRLCDNCQEDYDGNDKLIVARLQANCL